MKTEGVSQISVITTLEAEEPIAALLETIFSVSPTIYTNVEKGHSVVTAYLRATPRVLREQKATVNDGLAALRSLGLDLGSAEIIIQKVPREDWAESWKKHFKTLQIGSSLMIKPSWSQQKPKPKQAVVVLDPGLSFGTGQHATTSFCLRQIAQAARRRSAQSFLDAGCGSGILALSAAKLGFRPIVAFDFDPVGVRIARKNCQTNRVDSKVLVSRLDLTRMPLKSPKRYDLICANLISTLLLSERDKLLNRLAPEGTIVLAGILSTEFATVQAAYEEKGLKLVQTKIEREWQSGAFRQMPQAP